MNLLNIIIFNFLYMWIFRAILDMILCALFGHKWFNERITLNPDKRVYQKIHNCYRCGTYKYIDGTEEPILNDKSYKI